MSLISRLFHGAVQQLTSAGRAAFMPFSLLWNMGKTVLTSVNDLAHGNFGKAWSDMITGTAHAATRAGLDVAEGAVPGLAFAEGFLANRSSPMDVVKQVATKLV